MNWESLKDARNARKAANALAAVCALAVLSLWLECKAEWRWDQIFASFCSFIIVSAAVLIRFSARREVRGDSDELWITAVWTWLVGRIARVIQRVAQDGDEKTIKPRGLLTSGSPQSPRDGGV